MSPEKIELVQQIEALIENDQTVKAWFRKSQMLQDWLFGFKSNDVYGGPKVKDEFVNFTYGLGRIRDLLLHGNNTVYIK